MQEGVEDIVSNYTVAAKALNTLTDRMSQLIAIEMILATHAIHRRGIASNIAPRLRPIVNQILSVSPPPTEDRSLSVEIDTIANWIRNGDFSEISDHA